MAAPADGTMARLFPGVPPLWVAGRLLALALAAVLLSAEPTWAIADPLRASAPPRDLPRRSLLRWLALGIAVLQALGSPWAGGLGPLGQTAYFGLLFVPAALLAFAVPRPARAAHSPVRRHVVAIGVVILLWTAFVCVRDLGSPRAADAVDGWRGIVGLVRFSTQGHNLLTELWDLDLPGLGALPLLFMGEPFFEAGLLPLTLPAAQLQQMIWIAVTAAGIGVLAGTMVGSGTAIVAVAVFLFAPYTRFTAVLPGPFAVGPLYGAALALAALAVCRRRSEAALAALGALAGVALTFPGIVPVAAFLTALALWHVRREWRRCWLGALAGLAVWIAVIVPAFPAVLAPERMGQHFRAHGSATLLEAAILGQAPLATFERARGTMVSHPLEIVAAALIEPFANPRTPIRLWGDAIFDPVGAVLLAIGLATALRSVRAASGARFLLVFFLIALAPAFVSPVDRVDIVHAVALPVPVALLAAAGAAQVLRRCGVVSPRRRAAWTAAAVGAIAVGGVVLFDVVNPRLLCASAPGIVFRALRANDAPRAVLLDYPPRQAIDVRWLFTGVLSAYGGPEPLGYLQYGGDPLPAEDFAAEGKDLLFWSPGLDADLAIGAAVCRQWPAATLYELRDPSGLGRAHAALLGATPWTPAGPSARWRRFPCAGV
jgi:hypothetical protein